MRAGLQSLTRSGCLLVAILTATADTRAQTVATATGRFIVNPRTALALSPMSLSFPNADPDSVPKVSPSEGSLSVNVITRFVSGQAILTVLASDDLRSGMTIIPVSALKWTATGAGYVGGTVNKSVAQPMASWNNSGNYLGAVSFTFDNSWTYAIGSYATILTYTLTTP